MSALRAMYIEDLSHGADMRSVAGDGLSDSYRDASATPLGGSC
jgi:hypothetical protein